MATRVRSDPATEAWKRMLELMWSQRGRFILPPARFFRMYQPEDKALEGEGRTRRMLEVR